MNVTSEISAEYHVVGGIVLAVVSVIGVLANCYVFVSVLHRRKTRSSFLYLCSSKALYNFIVRDSYAPYVVNVILGNLVGGTMYLGGVLTQVLASINRLVASFSIHLYNRLCTLRNTMIIVALCWVGTLAIALLYCLIELLIDRIPEFCLLSDGVGYIFHQDLLVWQGDGQQLSADAFEIIGMLVYSSTGVMFILNIITFAKLVMLTKVSQDCLYLVDMLFAQVLVGLLEYDWWKFICLSFVWLSLNTIDGIVMIVFVKELCDPLKRQLQRMVRVIRESTRDQNTNELFKRRKSKPITMATASSSNKY
ncbi:unnamed protein product [Nippostrongylus brasiliensis]|uniref:7TM_GPCR_Srx domain-containing protein n=1 Tax=Nippostrongylus brasiliensis TaxID=27835 RepID=A0A0N4Y9Z4_NIPBR|nr:unnamed protein product [Nippostrongylus brasiliensis]